MHHASLAVISLVVMSCTAAAQQRPAPRVCGDRGRAERTLERQAELFTADSHAEFRERNSIQRLAADAEMRVVTDPRVCGRLMGLLRERVAKSWEPSPNLSDIEWAVFQYGPYYAIIYDFKRDVSGGPIPFLIIDAKTLEVVAEILV
jgi:hypothetical protein